MLVGMNPRDYDNAPDDHAAHLRKQADMAAYPFGAGEAGRMRTAGRLSTFSDEEFRRRYVAPLMAVEITPRQGRELTEMVSTRVRVADPAPSDPKPLFDENKAPPVEGSWSNRLTQPSLGAALRAADDMRNAALRADAERLAELREERRRWESKLMGALRLAKLDAIIAVYEELAARGLTFGGGR